MVNRKKKKGALPPRAKRMDRLARLQSARVWLKNYDGKNIAAGYRRHFAVDWSCAFRELEMLGVRIDAAYKEQILKSVEGHIAARRRRKSRRGEIDESRLSKTKPLPTSRITLRPDLLMASHGKSGTDSIKGTCSIRKAIQIPIPMMSLRNYPFSG